MTGRPGKAAFCHAAGEELLEPFLALLEVWGWVLVHGGPFVYAHQKRGSFCR
jgi:hypothetical protein